MFIEAAIIGLLIGGFRNGRLANITDMNIRGWFLILISLVVSLIPVFLGSFESISGLNNYFLLFSMIIVTAVVILNLDKKGVWIILIGALYNMGIIIFHGFKMPVEMIGLVDAGLTSLHEGITSGNIVTYVASTSDGIMKIFTKFIIIPKPYPFPKVMTIGDIIMTLGVIVMLVGEMTRASYQNKGKMIQYSYGSAFKRR